MASSSMLSLRLDTKMKSRLDRLAKATKRSRSYIAAEAIREYLAVNEWQISEIRKGLEESDRGDFAAAEEVKRVRAKWTKRAR